MNALDQLNGYLRSIENRLRLFAVSRGAAVLCAVALVVTVALVFITNRYAFSDGSLLWARAVLFLSLAVAISAGLLVPLFRLSRRHAARRAEARFPEFKERLLTVAESPDTANPFVQLIADDAMTVARANTPDRLISGRAILGLVSSAGIAAVVLIWLFLAGPGYLGYGTALLWAGPPKPGVSPFYDILVSPGDKMVRRRADQMIQAQLVGFATDKVRLYAKYGGTSKWEQVLMQPQPHGSAFEFLFGGLAENVEYYVEAGAVHSKHYTLRVVNLPEVKKIRVTYNYPSWTGLKPAVEDPGGDLRAVEGTEADVAIQTDRPLDKGVLMLADDSQIPLKAGDGNVLLARVPIQKDGMYHVAAIEQGENVRLSEDYFIEAKKVTPPVVKLVRPARDSKVNPIEEVPVAVEASDDFGLQEVSLRYSVNGGPEKSVPLLGHPGAKEANGKHTIALEDFKMVPGDVVSLYAVARDARNTVKTDMYFVQAEPFERNYSQSQQAGGGMQGGGDDDQNRISDRQKEIIAATWNEIKLGAKDAATARDDAKFLAQLQGKLADQARSLAQRMRARQLSGANSEFQSFAKDMEAAAAEMGNAVEKIKNLKWTDGLGPEQRALQNLLRAEDTFRDIQVAFGSQSGGAGQGMGRDLENLFDLELDTEKNQYETGQRSASAGQREKDIDEALQKLKELAKRQQELAAQQQKQQQAFRQRWEQEMLRREAEELQRKMEQLQRGDSSQQQGNSQDQQASNSSQSSSSQSASSQSSASRSGRSGQTGQRASDQRMQEAIERLKQAADDMRRAESMQNGSPEQGAAGQRRAADRLQEASDLLNSMRRDQASNQVDDLVRKAQQLASHQTDYQNRLRQMVGGQNNNEPFQRRPGQSSSQANAMASEKEQMAGEVKQLEDQIAGAARSMAGTQPSTSSKLRDALSEAQQNELDLRMRKAAEWIRQGLGMAAWMRESTVTLGLDQLQQKLQDAQASMRAGDKNGKPGEGKEQLERALAQLERTRERMQQMADARRQGQQGQRGQQPGDQGQPGQQGRNAQGQQQSGQQQGQQPGGQQPGGQQPGAMQGQTGPGGGGPAIQSGDRDYAGGDRGGFLSPHNGYLPEGVVREAQRDLGELRQQLQGNPDLLGDVQQLMRQLQKMDVYQNPGLLSDRISREVLPEMERLELELRRELGEGPEQVRNPASDKVPSGYADAVAEYFRKLSKGK